MNPQYYILSGFSRIRKGNSQNQRKERANEKLSLTANFTLENLLIESSRKNQENTWCLTSKELPKYIIVLHKASERYESRPM